jgi:hypothetical protein
MTFDIKVYVILVHIGSDIGYDIALRQYHSLRSRSSLCPGSVTLAQKRLGATCPGFLLNPAPSFSRNSTACLHRIRYAARAAGTKDAVCHDESTSGHADGRDTEKVSTFDIEYLKSEKRFNHRPWFMRLPGRPQPPQRRLHSAARQHRPQHRPQQWQHRSGARTNRVRDRTSAGPQTQTNEVPGLLLPLAWHDFVRS